MIPVLFAAPKIEPRSLDMPFLIGTDPHLRPPRRDHEFPDTLQLPRVPDHLIVEKIAEPLPFLNAHDPRLTIPHIPQVSHRGSLFMIPVHPKELFMREGQCSSRFHVMRTS